MKLLKKKKSTEKRYKLANRISLFAGITTTVILAIICLLSGIATRAIVSDLTKEHIKAISQNNADLVNSYLQKMDLFSTSLTYEVNRYKILGREQGENLIIESLNGVLEDENIFGVYYAFEPNKYFEDTPDGLSYYAYKDVGKTGLDILNDYSSYSSDDYYTNPKGDKQAHITEPYQYKLSNGKTVDLVTLSNPILDKSGNFLGIVSCDILSEKINEIPYSMGEFETAYCTVMSQKGKFIANTIDSSIVGETLEATNDTCAEILEAASSAKELITDGNNPLTDNDSIIMCTPVQLAGTDIVWTTTFAVDNQEAFEHVNIMLMIIVIICGVGIVILVSLSVAVITKKLKPLQYVLHMATKMRDADLDGDEYKGYKFDNNELGEVGNIFVDMSIGMTAILKDISRLLTEMSEGNFDIKSACPQRYIGEYVHISASLEKIKNNLNAILQEIDVSSDELNSSSDQVSDAAQALSQGATEQAASIEELSATIGDVTEKITNTAQFAQNTRDVSSNATSSVLACNEQMNSLLTAMGEISEKSSEIGKIIKTIDDIAFQTNILALNAAVEAARAGSAGKGFAVVADEVRSLAAKSAEAAKNTTDLIKGSIYAVQNGTNMAQATADVLSDIVTGAQDSTAALDKIAQASQEQSVAVEEINRGVEQISAVVQNNSATAQQTAASSEQLSIQAEKLKKLVDQFDLKETDEYCKQ